MGGPPLLGNVERCKKGKPVTCRISGCEVEVTSRYYKRFQVCPSHLRADAIMEDGILKRFCQQHNKFHPVGEFQDKNRSCRESLQRKKQKSLREGRSRASRSDSTGNTNSTRHSSSEGSSHGCDQSEFCGKDNVIDDESAGASVLAQNLEVGACPAHPHQAALQNPTSVCPISIDRMPGESSKDGYIIEPSDDSGALDEPSSSSGEVRPWEIFVPPLSGQQANPVKPDLLTIGTQDIKPSLDMMPSIMNRPAMALNDTRQGPVDGGQWGSMVTPHRFGEASGINYGTVLPGSAAYQLTGDLLSRDLREHGFGEMLHTHHHQSVHDALEPIFPAYPRASVVPKSFEEQLAYRPILNTARAGSYQTAVSTLSEGITSMSGLGDHANWMTMKLSGVDPSLVPEDILLMVSQRFQNQLVHGSMAREGCVALHFDLISRETHCKTPSPANGDEVDIAGFSLVTDPMLRDMVRFICGEDCPKCLSGPICLQTESQVVQLDNSQITLILSKDSFEGVVPTLQHPMPLCLSTEGGKLDVEWQAHEDVSPTFFTRFRNSAVRCTEVDMEPVSNSEESDERDSASVTAHRECSNGSEESSTRSTDSDAGCSYSATCVVAPFTAATRVARVECESGVIMSTPSPVLVLPPEDCEEAAAELGSLLKEKRVSPDRFKRVVCEMGWILESKDGGSPPDPPQCSGDGDITVGHIKPYSDCGKVEYAQILDDMALRYLGFTCRMGFTKLTSLLLQSWAINKERIRQLVEWRSLEGWSLLHLAMLSGNPRMVSTLRQVAQDAPSRISGWNIADKPCSTENLQESWDGIETLLKSLKIKNGRPVAPFTELWSLISRDLQKHDVSRALSDEAPTVAAANCLTPDPQDSGLLEGCQLAERAKKTWRTIVDDYLEVDFKLELGWMDDDAGNLSGLLVWTIMLLMVSSLTAGSKPTASVLEAGKLPVCPPFSFLTGHVLSLPILAWGFFTATSCYAWKGPIAAALRISDCLLSTLHSVLPIRRFLNRCLCLEFESTTPPSSQQDNGGVDITIFNLFQQTIRFHLHLILAAVEIAACFITSRMNFLGPNQGVVDVASTLSMCMLLDIRQVGMHKLNTRRSFLQHMFGSHSKPACLPLHDTPREIVGQ